MFWESVKKAKTPEEMEENIRYEFQIVMEEYEKATDTAMDVTAFTSTEEETEEAWRKWFYNEKRFYPFPIVILNWLIEDAKVVFPNHDWERVKNELNYMKEDEQK